MTTILVVDDETDFERLIRGRFRTKIRENIYDFRFVLNGRQAMEQLQNEPGIDLVLLDINMPEMDGLSLLRQLPAINPILQVVMVSAYGDINNIRTAMNLGAFDFIFKPIDFGDLEITIDKTVQHILQLRESRQLKVIDELKTRFFDNITHEFRTPLTLILSPVGQLISEFTESGKLQRGLLSIERNARYLLRLINQLLDLAKLESGELKVKAVQGDLGKFAGEIIEAFEPLAAGRNLELTFESDLVSLYEFDPEKMEQILFNLLTNALKFTARGKVVVHLHTVTRGINSPIQISVSDTGIGIGPEKFPKIFNRFYQGATLESSTNNVAQWPGTGIGLALVKELTDLMGGVIEVESNVDLNYDYVTKFTIELPLKEVTDNLQEHFQPSPVLVEELATDDVYQHGQDWNERQVEEESLPLILLVEDDNMLREFLADNLSTNFRIMTASNGADAWNLARQELPDIVVSDVHMPVFGDSQMNGFQLTRNLKSDPLTDHIAVILLTAKSSHQNLMEGLSQGADEYVSKPFHLNELKLRLHNVIQRQQKLQLYYQQQLAPKPNSTTRDIVHDQFLVKLYNLIDTNLDAPLSVDWVADALAMSRKTLYRKVQSLTQLSPNQLIRNYRLRRAADFLQAGHPISETAYRVGFETPSHFAQAFKELYQQTPSEFAGR